MSTYTDAIAAVGGLSNPSKMPTLSWSTPAKHCGVGSALASLEGTVCSGCYASKGCYQFPSTVAAMDRRWDVLQGTLRDARDRDTFLDAFRIILAGRLKRTLAAIKRTGKPGRDDGRFFRWHDSGDVQGLAHLRIIVAIARENPGVAFWLPTREAGTVRQYLEGGETFPLNLQVKLSVARVNGAIPPVYERMRVLGAGQVSVSGVHTGDAPVVGQTCIAYTQDGACRDCRACWTREDVSYPLH